MDDTIYRLWTELIGRLSGPLTLRLYLQPAMAALLAIRDGMKDARTGQPPFLWTVLTDRSRRRALSVNGLKSIAKVIAAAIVLDLIYALIVYRSLRPVETFDVAILLAVVPYALLRGPVNRLARRRIHQA